MAKESKPKRPVGRPPLKMPEMIPDTPTNVARMVLNSRPKKEGEWRYQKAHKESKQR